MTVIKKHGNVIICIAFTALLTVFASCATIKGGDADKAEADPNFIGDFDPIRLEDAMALRKVFNTLL